MSTHLYVRSYYSLLESSLSIGKIVSLACQNHMASLALCDHNVMYGSIAFYRACEKNSIKPLIALECDITYDGYDCSVLLYARNNDGYRKLVHLSSLINIEHRRLSLEEIFDSNLIMVMLTDGGIFDRNLLQFDERGIIDKILWLKQNMSLFYIGLYKQEYAYNAQRNAFIKDIAQRNGVKCVAVARAACAAADDQNLLKALSALYNKTTVTDPDLADDLSSHFRTVEEMLQLYAYEDILNSDEIASLCNVNLDEEKCQLLSYPDTKGASAKDFLRQLCIMGLKKRFLNQSVPLQYQSRLNYELKVISKMKYDDYFLIVYDFIRFARKQGIYVGPGRGSAAGSLVSYSLGITHVDPIRYNLLFERFLNPERISMPDIDVDFPDNRRQEVIDYVRDKYGQDRVAHIIAFSTMQAKAAIDAACEALGVDKKKMDYAKRYLPRNVNGAKADALKDTYEKNYKFRQIIDSEEVLTQVYQLAVRLEGMPKNITTHACGIVMSDRPLEEVIPLCDVGAGVLSTQISAEYLESLGLLKMDFLGIRNLSIIDRVCRQIEPPLDILRIPDDDVESYRMISEGKTTGLFQLESEGMTSTILRIKPRNLEELSDTLALYRPGAMAHIPEYLANREDPDAISYLHPSLAEILRPTYGVAIYQEQVMQIAQKVGGFSLGRADLLRRAISKKKESELLALEEEFKKGARKNGYSAEVADSLYQMILQFAGYGFNKSHSVAYSLVAYQMAYLKSRYPKIFMSCLLDNVVGDENKTYRYIEECRRLNIKILNLSINHAGSFSQAEEEGIRLSLRCIKGLGNNIVETIVSERESGGEYTDFFDFVARLNNRRISRSSMESLIDAGALDEFGYNRASLRASMDDALKYAELIRVEWPDQTYLDFNLVYKPRMTTVDEWVDDKLAKEQSALGFYLSRHPIEILKEKFHYQGKSVSLLQKGENRVRLMVRIVRIRNHTAKSGPMAFLSVDDETGSIDAVVLPNVYSRTQDLLLRGKTVYITGRVDDRSDKMSVVVNEIQEVK